MRGELEEDNTTQSLVRQSLTDRLYLEAKALSGGLPFPGSGGGGGGMVPVYSSWDSWDQSFDLRFGGSERGRNYMEYANKVGDLASNSLLVSAIRWLGNAIQEAMLVVKESPGGKGKSEAVEDHPLPKLWNRPNEYYSGSTLRKAIAFSWILNSQSFILKNFNDAGTEVMELWWEPHWTIRPVWPLDGSEFISYYEVNRNGSWLKIPVENVIHLRDGLSPYNQRVGFSGVPSVLAELYGDGEAAEYYARLMGGSAVPPFLVSLDAGMRIDQPGIDAFTRDIINKTTGKRKGSPIVARGAKAYKLGFNPHELDLRETRYMAEDRFCAVMGIPAVVLELGTGMAHSIYNNVKQAEERAWNSYMKPMLKQIQEELTVQLLDDWEDPDTSKRYCDHDYSKVQALSEDIDAKAKRNGKLYMDGLIMRSEGRSDLNYGPSDPNNEDADKVFSSNRGQSLLKPGEDPLQLTGQQSSVSGGPPGSNKNPVIAKPAAASTTKPKKAAALALVKALLTTTNDTGLTWEKYPSHWGSLGISRESMPQVKSEHRGAMVRFLKGRGIAHTIEEVNPDSLKPSQADYSPEKVQKAREWIGPQRPLLVSNDNYVADGHHQWTAALDNPQTKIPVIRLDSKILELLLEIARFPSSGVAAMKALFELEEDEEFDIE